MEGLGLAKVRLIAKIIEETYKIKPESKQYNYNELLYVIHEMLDQEGTKYLQEDDVHGGPYAKFRRFVELILYRNIANYDSMILLTSDKGGGKSSAALMIAKEWCRLIGIKFDPKIHFAYNNNDVMRCVDELPKFSPVVADESVRFASSEDWSKTSNKLLKRKLAQVRTKHLLFILCFPLKIYKLEKTYLESYCTYWCEIFGRGDGAVFVKDKNPVHDTWRLKDFLKLSAYNEFTPKSTIERELKKHPNFWQTISFPKPDDTLYNRYLAVRELNVYDDPNVLSAVNKTDIHMALMILAFRDIMTHDPTLTINRILLHVKNEYQLTLQKSVIEGIIEDSKQLILKVHDKTIEL
jgi:hypothetical protein